MKKSLLLLPLIALLAACDGNRGDEGQTIVRINGKAFTEEDLDTRLSTLPDDQRERVLRNPEERRLNFDNVLRTRLFSLAAQQAVTTNLDSLGHRLSLFDQRVVTQYYFTTFIGEYGMHTRKEIEEFYRSNPSKFTGDSGKVLPLSKVVGALADSLLVSHANLDSFYQANRKNYAQKACDTCPEEALAPLESRRMQVAADYVRDFKEKRNTGAIDELKAKYKIKLVDPNKPVTEAEIKTYYEQNKDAYESPESFELYDIEVTNKTKAENSLKTVKDLDGFKALASKITENPLTKPQAGYLGVVKRDFCLPYGVGMFPALFQALDQTNAGKVKEPLQSPDTQKWHFFWLAQKAPRQQKPLDRVHALVKTDLVANHLGSVKPEDTLAVFGDGRLLRESDVIFLRAEIPPSMQERYTRESLVNFLLTWQLAFDEAKSLGLLEEKRLIAARLQNEDDFWGRVYQDSVLSKSYEEDPALLAKTFSEKRGLFTRDSADTDWRKYAHDIAGYLTLTPKDFNIEYYTYPERYRRDTVLPELSTVMYEVFQNLKPTAFQRLDKKVLETLKSRFKVEIVDPTLLEPSLEPATESYKLAQSLHYDRKLDKALELYGKLRDKFPERTALQDSICFGLAQIYLEQERYPQAMAEYRRVSYLYPTSANNYKAMFMVGFIYSEHLKNDSAAVQAFDGMLKKYPGTDLSDDADWMIRNIRSGGKLMPKLEGDSTTVAPDAKTK